MPRSKKNKTALKRSLLQTCLLLVLFLLLFLGTLPILIIKYPFSFLGKFKGALSLKIPFLPRGRGRPRKTPFLRFYLRRFKKNLYSQVPKPIRVAVVLSLALFIFISYTYATFRLSYELPNPDRLVTPNQPLTTEFYDRNGLPLYRMYEGVNRSLVPLSEIPADLVHATIAIEDQNFYKHIGIDLGAIIRALHTNYKNGTMEGASTLTQQLIKNSLLTPEKTYTRKIKEIILSLWAERLYTKADILQMYFNEAPYGGPHTGIGAAAQTYFGKLPQELNLAQSAYLAGLPASPTQLSPYGTQPEMGKIRQTEVLRRMVEDGYITRSQADDALEEELNIKPPSAQIKAPHFVMYVKNVLAQKYGTRAVNQGGLKVYTTLDLEIQETVEKIVEEEVGKLASLNVSNGAAMVTDPKTGQILAMDGSVDYYKEKFGNYNVALALRQQGSIIKPITYAAIFKQGFSPGNTILDTPVVFKDEWGNGYAPVNYDGKFHGAVSIRTALASSYNLPAVKAAAIVGVDKIVELGKSLGITTWNNSKNYGLSITLGAADVRMIDMMSVYGTFAQMGKKRIPTGILKVTDSNGNILEEYKDNPTQVLSPQIAYLITHILADNKAREPAFGPNSLLKIDNQEVAVKTGTADNKTNNVAYGYSPDFVVGAWVGNPDNQPMHPSLTSGITGATPIWHEIMKSVLAKTPSIGFKRPEGVVDVTVDGRKDLAVAESIPRSATRKQDQTSVPQKEATTSAITSVKKLNEN